jgi:formylglycine-generating enzyme required for sulfatase activity
MMGAKPNEIRREWFWERTKYNVYRDDDVWASRLDELPRHRVEVDIPIAMGRNEVTYDEWMACVMGGGCDGYVPKDRIINKGRWIGGTHPVVRVSVLDAKAYVRWLNRRLGTKAYRLPTEAEWEYAARAGTETRFVQGDTVTSEQANFSGADTENVTRRSYPELKSREKPLPVEMLDAANAWGLRHMSGNAGEFTSSCYTESGYKGWPSTSEWLRQVRPYCKEYATRGGNYSSPMDVLRTAWRGRIRKDLRVSTKGFRVVKQLSEGK